MQLAAYLLGDPGRLPFLGHFRIHVRTQEAMLVGAGRIAAQSGMVPAFRAARGLEAVLNGLRPSPGAQRDRHALIRDLWATLSDIDSCDLGAGGGADLSLMLAARDASGMGITGVGLGGVWRWEDSGIAPLVEGAHPLLGKPGLPEMLPGILTLDEPVGTIVGTPRHLDPVLPKASLLPTRCGVHP